MGLFKKCYGCKSCPGRVRQKPQGLIQLDMFGEINNERVYVRSSKKRKTFGQEPFKKNVFWRSAMDSSNECS